MPKFLMYFRFFIALFYAGLGVYMIVYSSTQKLMPHNYSIIFGAILIVYGAFRGYRTYKNDFQDKDA